MKTPSKTRKFAFWILIGMISVVFVEVPTGSTMFPFFTIWGMLVVLPLYLLHSVFLVALVFRFGRPHFWTLYSAGTLYGMYEAYITKVLWTSFRPEGPLLTVGGIALIETIILVLFLHPLLAFVVPMFFTEVLCTNSSEIAEGLPRRWRASIEKHPALAIGLLMALLGFMQFVNSPSALQSFLSGLGNSVGLGLALLWWRKSGGAAYSLRELLPGSNGIKVFGVVLLGWYVFTGLAIHRNSIPAVLHGQLTIWLIYGGLLLIFLRCLDQSRSAPSATMDAGAFPGAPFRFSWRGFTLACVTATTVATICRLALFPFAIVQIGIMFTFFVVLGISFMTGLLNYTIRPLPKAKAK